MTLTLDASCPVAPLLPYLLHFNATEAEQWAQNEADSFGSALPVAIVLTVCSVLLLFAGERLTRMTLFLGGALVTFVVSLLLANSALSAASASPTAGCITLIVVPLILGLLGGALMLYLVTLAFACVGFAAGAAAGQALYILVLHRVSTGVTLLDHDLFYFIVLLALAIPGSILMAKYREALMVVSTAALGAVGLVPGLAILILARFDARFLWVTDPTDANDHRSSPFVYGQALAVLLYFPLGVAVQRHFKRKRGAVASEQVVQPYVVFQDPAHRFGSSNA